jgi:hypothetical protein
VEVLRALRGVEQVGRSIGERNAATAAAFILGGLKEEEKTS